MFGIGTTELIIIALVLMVIFGSQKMTEMAKGLGKTKKELDDIKKELEKE